MTFLNGGIYQFEQEITENNILIFNDESEVNFFNRLYVCLLEKTDKIEQAFEDKLMQKDKQIAVLVM